MTVVRRKKTYLSDPFDEEEELDDAFDENGILKDGARYRVSMLMRDGLPPPSGKHVLYDVPPSRAAADSQPTFDALHRPGFLRDSRTLEQLDALEQAYREADEADANRWQTPSNGAAPDLPAGRYPLSAGAGNACTINGAPGTLQREGDWLVCVPSKKTDSMPTVDAREQAYRDYDEEMANRWRTST